MNQILRQNYFDASLPGSLSGFQSFSRALTERDVKVAPKKIKEFLKSEPTYSLHRPARRKYKRNKVISLGIDYLWQIDLVDMQKFAKLNKGFKYLLTCIDVLSKFAWVLPINLKEGNSILLAFIEILKTGRKPVKIQSDEGKEFLNSAFKNYLTKENISLYIVNSELKASVVERFNRTLKEKMWRNFTFRGKYVYFDELANMTKAYNKSYHRTIQMKPVDVDSDNEQQIYERVFKNESTEVRKFNFKIDDKVRISKYKTVFSKGYTPNWSEEIFKVSEQIAREPNVYRISKDDDIFKVEEILRTRVKNKQKEVLVKWLGYPEKFNSWEPAQNIIGK
jgi:hypothetical protein